MPSCGTIQGHVEIFLKNVNALIVQEVQAGSPAARAGSGILLRPPTKDSSARPTMTKKYLNIKQTERYTRQQK